MSGLPAIKMSEGAQDFIDEAKINSLLAGKRPAAARVRDIIAKSMSKVALNVRETADLLLADSPDLIEEIFDAARELKKNVYGNRIVLFAPLYIGNKCVNDWSSAYPVSSKSSVPPTPFSPWRSIWSITPLRRHGRRVTV